MDSVCEGVLVEGYPTATVRFRKRSWAKSLNTLKLSKLSRKWVAMAATGAEPFAESTKYEAIVPQVPTGDVAVFQVVQTLVGLAIAGLLDWAGAEDFLRGLLRLDASQRSLGIALAIVALVAQFVMLPAMRRLMQARQECQVGQPIHHPAPGELASEDDRMLWLHKLRAYENIVEWLPVFIAQSIAACVLGKVGVTCMLCIPYTVGKLIYTFGYGSGNSENRIAGLIMSDLFSLLVLRGVLLIEVCRHVAGS